MSESGLLFNPVNGESYGVNVIGMAIINYLKEGRTIKEICQNILEEFESDWNTIERDILDFTQQLKFFNLIIDKP